MVATRLRTLTGSVRSRAEQAICESIPYHDPFRAGEREEEEDGGGFAFAVQLHREVKPESGLVGIVEHIEVNKR